MIERVDLRKRAESPTRTQDRSAHAGTFEPSSILGLQRMAGNAAVASLLGPPPRAVQRDAPPAAASAPPATTVAPLAAKHTLTIPDQKVGEKDWGYVTAGLKVGGTVDLEVTPPTGPTTPSHTVNVGGASVVKPPDSGGGGVTVKPAAGVNVDTTGAAKYQGEVTTEFEKRTVALLGESTPKFKLGGEAGSKGGKLGIEFSMEGQAVEPKFAMNFFEADLAEGNGIKFATLEAAFDWKMADWTYVASDGSSIKIAPKVTPKLGIEPSYKRLGIWLLEQFGTAVAVDAAIAGGMILAGAGSIVGFLLTMNDGYDEAKVIDEASLKARPNFVRGFVNGATNEGGFDDDYSMEGHNWGQNWRLDLERGNRGPQVPIPASVVTTKAKENKGKIEADALKAANQVFHQWLVEQYWEIHYIEKRMGGSIANRYMMLMEGNGFGRPGPKEGK